MRKPRSRYRTERNISRRCRTRAPPPGQRADAGGGAYQSPGSGAKPQGSGKAHTVTPLTIKVLAELAMCSDASDDLVFNSVEVGHISVVGKVVAGSVDANATHCTFRLHDGTGWAEVQWFPDGAGPAGRGDDGGARGGQHRVDARGAVRQVLVVSGDGLRDVRLGRAADLL